MEPPYKRLKRYEMESDKKIRSETAERIKVLSIEKHQLESKLEILKKSNVKRARINSLLDGNVVFDTSEDPDFESELTKDWKQNEYDRDEELEWFDIVNRSEFSVVLAATCNARVSSESEALDNLEDVDYRFDYLVPLETRNITKEIELRNPVEYYEDILPDCLDFVKHGAYNNHIIVCDDFDDAIEVFLDVTVHAYYISEVLKDEHKERLEKMRIWQNRNAIENCSV
jgi:hypothetical protein